MSKEIAVNFSVRIDLDKLAAQNWHPARLKALFEGLSQVIAAKGYVDAVAANRKKEPTA